VHEHQQVGKTGEARRPTGPVPHGEEEGPKGSHYATVPLTRYHRGSSRMDMFTIAYTSHLSQANPAPLQPNCPAGAARLALQTGGGPW
jgi:hypothetical protein